MALLLSVLFVLLLRHQRHVQSIPIKSVNLSTTNIQQDGASVTLLVNESTINLTNNEWQIYSNNRFRTGFQMQIDLDDSWGFHPNKSSQITVMIFSNDIISETNRDLLLSFSVENNEYVSMSTSANENNEIYPNCSQIYPAELAQGDIKSWASKRNGWARANKVMGSDHGYYMIKRYMIPLNLNYNKSCSYPIIIQLENDPINNISFVSYTNPEWLSSGFYQKCIYTSFKTENGLQMYLAGDSNYELYTFNTFYIQYDYDYEYDTTYYPTINPTFHPIKIYIIIVAVIIMIIIIIVCCGILYKKNKNQKDLSYHSPKIYNENIGIELPKHIHIHIDNHANKSENANKNNKIINIVNNNPDTTDTDCESLYESHSKHHDTPDNTTPAPANDIKNNITVNEGENMKEYSNNNNEYINIENILKNCDNKEWERYLFNFKKHKMNDYRLKHFINKDDKIWELLIPEYGLRVEFVSLYMRHKQQTSGQDFQQV